MEMASRERWESEIAEMRRVLAGFAMKEERKWGTPTYTVSSAPILRGLADPVDTEETALKGATRGTDQ